MSKEQTFVILSYNACFVYFIHASDVVSWLKSNVKMDVKSTTGIVVWQVTDYRTGESVPTV